MTLNKSLSSSLSPSGKPLSCLMYVVPFLVGGYHEWTSCLISLYLIGCLWYYRSKGISVSLPKTLPFLTACILAAGYAASTLWAIDRSMAFWGFVKILPLPLFCLAQHPLPAEERPSPAQFLPVTGVCMTLLSFLLSHFEYLSPWFLVSGRLAGFFQYPNTFALYLLLGVVMTIEKVKNRWKRPVYLAVLLGGIALSGSRTVFLLLLAVLVYYFFRRRDRSLRFTLAGLVILLLGSTILYATVTEDVSALSRYLTTSLSSSTFLGRFLYFRDALPVIAAHPFGLGYMGYFYAQGTFQTGVYSVVHVHNDLLQILLDIGWIPAILLIASVASALRRYHQEKTSPVLLIVLCLHCLFDFDLQYMSVALLLFLLLTPEKADSIRLPSKIAPTLIYGLLGCLCLFFGAVTGLFYLKDYDAVLALYPGCTPARIQLLLQAEDSDAMETQADCILDSNQYVSVAWSARARTAYGNGDFTTMIDASRRAIALTPYDLDVYLDYFDMLAVGVDLYTRAGDPVSADHCRRELLTIPQMLNSTLERTSPLGWRIDDRPELTLPPEYAARLAQYSE